MATLRCPRCSTLVSAAPGGTASCPSCGFTAKVPDAPAPAAPPSPTAAPPPTAPPPGWPAAGWTAATPAPSQPVPAPGFAPMAPAPGSMPPAWGTRGKAVEPAVVAVLFVATLGIYAIFFWWRVSREADLLKGHRHAHGLARTGILMSLLGGLVAALFVVVVLVQAFAALGPGEAPTEQEVFDAVAGAAPFLAVIVLAVLVAVAGAILLYVAQWRSWTSIRDAELAAGRGDPVNPALYLFLPLGLSLASNVFAGPFVALGWLLALASFAASVAFATLTQSHLNRLWGVAPPAPAPAPAAR